MELSHSCQRNRVANLVRRPQHREQQEREENDRKHASGPHSGKSLSSTSRRSAFQTTAALYSEFLHIPRLATSSMLVDNSANVHVCVHTLSQPKQIKLQTLTTSDWKAAIGSNSWHALQRIASISVSQIPARIEVEKHQNDKLGSQKNTWAFRH